MPFFAPDPMYSSDIASALKMTFEDNTSYGYYNNSPFDPFYPENGWKKKSVKTWSGEDILQWINSVARELGVCITELPGAAFSVLDGYHLENMTENEFFNKDKRYGRLLYEKLQLRLAQDKGYSGLTYQQEIKQEEPTEPTFTCLDDVDDSRSTGINSISGEDPPPPPPERRCRGRPRLPRKKKKTEKLGRLWEFLRDLLKNPEYCPSLISWENYEEGMFRFVHSDRVAKLWGSKKENPDMNYEKLSRAMRYYYKSKVLMPVYGRRLVYKFGPNATGWRVDNPNFENKP